MFSDEASRFAIKELAHSFMFVWRFKKNTDQKVTQSIILFTAKMN